jgi:uncharacterized membrane-anchored protein
MKSISLLVFLLFIATGESPAQASKYNPTFGPNRIILEQGNATLLLPEGYVYLGKAEANMLMKELGNPNTDIDGLLAPAEQTADWFVYLHFNPVGYFKMEEMQEELRGLDLLAEIKKRTESDNQQRMSLGGMPIQIVGYAQPLILDPRTNTLHFAIESSQGETAMVEHRTMFFCRKGYLLGSFVAPKERYFTVKTAADEIFSTLAFVGSYRYTDFNPDADSYSPVTIGGVITGKQILRKVAEAWTFLGLGIVAWVVTVVAVAGAGFLAKRLLG